MIFRCTTSRCTQDNKPFGVSDSCGISWFSYENIRSTFVNPSCPTKNYSFDNKVQLKPKRPCIKCPVIMIIYILLYQIIWYVLLKFRLSRIVNNACHFSLVFYAVTSFNPYFWVRDFINLKCIWQKCSAYLKGLSQYRRMVFFVSKSLVLFKRYSHFSIMQINQWWCHNTATEKW